MRMNAHRTGHARQRRWLQANALLLRQPAEHVVHALIGERIEPVEQALHRAAHEARGAPYRQTVRRRHVINAQILHRDLIVQAGVDAEQHARGVRWLREEAVDVIAKGQLQAKRHAAGAAADAARQVDVQGMIGIHHAALFGKLRLQPLACNGVAQEKGAGVFIVNEETVRIAFRRFSSLLHRHAVILLIFHDDDAVAAQFGFLPLAGVGRHMHRHLKADAGAHNADGHPKVAG